LLLSQPCHPPWLQCCCTCSSSSISKVARALPGAAGPQHLHLQDSALEAAASAKGSADDYPIAWVWIVPSLILALPHADIAKQLGCLSCQHHFFTASRVGIIVGYSLTGLVAQFISNKFDSQVAPGSPYRIFIRTGVVAEWLFLLLNEARP
jgi:hypothetical protein